MATRVEVGASASPVERGSTLSQSRSTTKSLREVANWRTTRFENLTRPERPVDVSREAEQIRAIEARCDDALTVRALTNGLDAVTNAVEDAADWLVYMSHKGR